MIVVFIIAGVVALISLYDYFNSRNWQQVTSNERNDAVFKNRNREYGAFAIRKDYDKRLMLIVGGMVAGVGVLFAATRNDEFHAKVEAPEVIVHIIPLGEDNPDGPDNGGTKPQLPPGPTGGGTEDGETTEEIVIPDEPAQFPGGHSEMMKFLGSKIVYPQGPAELGIEGRCFIQFVVSKKGDISDVKVMRGVEDCPECDKEAVRVIKSMPLWRPGRVKGKAVNSHFNLPVKFALQ